jgi:hypothetical protein
MVQCSSVPASKAEMALFHPVFDDMPLQSQLWWCEGSVICLTGDLLFILYAKVLITEAPCEYGESTVSLG